jgi:ketosteroid isomerase-like protein
MNDQATEAVVRRWYDALDRGDIKTALDCLAEDVDWDNVSAVPGVSSVLPWLGRFKGRDGAARAFALREPVVEVLEFKLRSLLIKGDRAVGLVYDRSRCKATGQIFEVEIAQLMQCRDGRIAVWKSICDTAPMVAAFRGLAA